MYKRALWRVHVLPGDTGCKDAPPARLSRGIWKSFSKKNHAQKTDLTSSTKNNKQRTKNIYVILTLWQPHFRGGWELRMTGGFCVS